MNWGSAKATNHCGTFNLYKEFTEYMNVATVNTPFPEKMFISKDRDGIPESVAKSFIDKGYQRLVGSLLWACRNVFAECTLGVSFLCRRMAHPDLDAWNSWHGRPSRGF